MHLFSTFQHLFNNVLLIFSSFTVVVHIVIAQVKISQSSFFTHIYKHDMKIGLNGLASRDLLSSGVFIYIKWFPNKSKFAPFYKRKYLHLQKWIHIFAVLFFPRTVSKFLYRWQRLQWIKANRWMCILGRTRGNMSFKKPAKCDTMYTDWKEFVCLFISLHQLLSWG
jgi:hypothetical protein